LEPKEGDMDKKTTGPIVVGIDGTEHSDRAVRYAVAEARRRQAPLTLVNAVHETAPMAAMLPLYSVEAFVEVGQRLVDDAEKLARDIDPTVEVGTSVKGGSRVGVLVDAGEHASLIVLGHRSRHGAGRVLASSTTSGVAARSHCPVVSVPDSWTGEDTLGRVVVGVDESEASHDALSVAFAEARRRAATLVVLHAWRLPSAYDDIAWSRGEVEDWMRTAGEEMDKTLAPFRDAFPDVAVEVDLRHEYAGPAMLSATEGADLIVVGRRGHGSPFGIYLGSLARMLIREGRCPVEVAPQHPRHTPSAEERLLVTDGEASPQD
jgi:nucleotide-binding universal stress UspA family protein